MTRPLFPPAPLPPGWMRQTGATRRCANPFCGIKPAREFVRSHATTRAPASFWRLCRECRDVVDDTRRAA